ncbi:MAG: DegV family protein [Sarcina sp.]
MEKIAILTDSSCDLNREDKEKYGIFSLPLRIIYKDREYLDYVNITPKEIYDNFENEIPSTSLPSNQCINDVLDRIEAEGYTHVIGIFVAQVLSGTYNAVRLQIQERTAFKYELLDSKIVGHPIGVMAMELSKLVSAGKTFDEIIELFPTIKDNTYGYFTVNTLEYLTAGGRIGKVAGTVGDFLNLKPIITVDEEGNYITAAKARGRKKAIKGITEIANNLVEEGPCSINILHGGALDEVTPMYEYFKEHPNVKEISLRHIGAAMGVHTGPKLLGFSLIKKY